MNKHLCFLLFLLLVFNIAEAVDEKSFNEGLEYYNEHSFDKALDTFKDIINENPDDMNAHYYLGLTWLELNEPMEAVIEFNRAYELMQNELEYQAEIAFALSNTCLTLGNSAICYNIMIEILENTDSDEWTKKVSDATGIKYYIERLTYNKYIDNSASFSSDGKKIVYCSNMQIWTMNDDGTNQKQLYTRGEIFNTSFSPISNIIIFTQILETGRIFDGDPFMSEKTEAGKLHKEKFALRSINLDGSNMQDYTPDTERGASTPHFTPDGKQIIYNMIIDSNIYRPMYLLDLDTMISEQIIFPDSLPRSRGEFFPNQDKICYESLRGLNWDIYIYDFENGEEEAIASHSAVDIMSSVSPDGEKIAYASNRRGAYAIYITDLAGKNIEHITSGYGGNDWEPEWSPDGESIIFSSDRDNSQFEIYRLWLNEPLDKEGILEQLRLGIKN